MELQHDSISAQDLSSGRVSVRIKVPGYWSQDSIRVTGELRWNWKASQAERQHYDFKVDITHSTGGRDTDEIEDDVEAAEWFARGMMLAVELAREIRGMEGEIRAAHDARRAADEAANAALRAAELAKVEADEALGEAAATKFVEEFIKEKRAEVKGTCRVITAKVMGYARGSEDLRNVVEVIVQESGAYFTVRSSQASKAKAIEAISQLSARGAQWVLTVGESRRRGRR